MLPPSKLLLVVVIYGKVHHSLAGEKAPGNILKPGAGSEIEGAISIVS